MHEYSFHPLADQYPLISGDDAAAMEQDMREGGFDRRFPIQIFQGDILDGRGRYTIARRVGIEPVFEEFNGSLADAEAFVRRSNENRRRLTDEWLEERRRQRKQARVERVAAAREAGESQRAIAESENISRTQVQRDLQDAQVAPPGPPEAKNGSTNGTVKGKDGKTYPAKKPRAKKPASKTQPKPTPKRDALGAEVPELLTAVFADEDFGITIAAAETALEAVGKLKPLLDRLKQKARFFPYLMLADCYKHFGDAELGAQCVLEAMRAGEPYAVCSCAGIGCALCRKGGYLPEWRHVELRDAGGAE